MKILVVVFSLSFLSLASSAQFAFTLKSGTAFNGYKDAQTPNNQGARFSASE
jgi:hypothetical protein